MVIPAKAGIQFLLCHQGSVQELDGRLRGRDGVEAIRPDQTAGGVGNARAEPLPRSYSPAAALRAFWIAS